MDLKRLTTEYVDIEDRIRLSGEAPDGTTVVMWLTQRFVNRLVPRLVQWLERQTSSQPRGELLQEFAQQAAVAALPAQAPVVASKPERVLLVRAIDVTTTRERVRFGFKGSESGAVDAGIGFDAKALRQWLGILHVLYRRAGWPTEVWPEWAHAQVQAAPEASVRH